MSTHKRLTELSKTVRSIAINDNSKIIIFSDCHRGDNSWADDFAGNQHLYFYALKHYTGEGFKYIELGDGEELWENKEFADIRKAYSNVFGVLSEVFKEDMDKEFDKKRLFLIRGNHDKELLDPDVVKRTLYQYNDEREKGTVPLFPGIAVDEGLKLVYSNGKYALLVHGHQGSLLEDRWWKVGRFLVRYIWRPLQLLGVKDPTSPARNVKKRDAVDATLAAWARENNTVLIAGHTHRPQFPTPGPDAYLNAGSCVHPRCITALEIADGSISLIKWCQEPDSEGVVRIVKQTIAGPARLSEYFGALKSQPAQQVSVKAGTMDEHVEVR